VVISVSPDKRPPAVARIGKHARAKHRRSREARRSRFLLIGGALLSAVILGAWFPANALFHQHASLASANAQLNELHQQDTALAQEGKDLSSSAEIARIAREQDQLVTPGQQAFEVLPPTGSTKASAPYAGDPALTAPVAPSSASELPPGSETGTTQTVTTTPSTTVSGGAKVHHGAASSGMLGRIVSSLEFWR
jgi:cell division protein FtsB